jgi:bacterioferritin
MLAASWGLKEVAEKFRAESSEEMEHAERIISRMLALGVAPNASQLRPVRLGTTLEELLQHDLSFERELVRLYGEAVQHCSSVGDADGRVFFEALLGEEQNHEKELLQWIEKL